MSTAAYDATRSALHAVAESLLAGPQHRRSGTIRLAVTDNGFSTLPIDGDVRRIAVEGADLVVDTTAGERRSPLRGTLGSLADQVGLDLGAPQGVYTVVHDQAPTTGISVAPDDLVKVLGSLARGDAALRRVGALEVGESAPAPVLWPEHFDVGVTIDEVNLGVSAGDGHIAEPYAYVGPPSPRLGAFWNQPFGAARPLAELPDVASVVDWFVLGLGAARHDPPA
jgi:hypothetical protein